MADHIWATVARTVAYPDDAGDEPERLWIRHAGPTSIGPHNWGSVQPDITRDAETGEPISAPGPRIGTVGLPVRLGQGAWEFDLVLRFHGGHIASSLKVGLHNRAGNTLLGFRVGMWAHANVRQNFFSGVTNLDSLSERSMRLTVTGLTPWGVMRVSIRDEETGEVLGVEILELPTIPEDALVLGIGGERGPNTAAREIAIEGFATRGALTFDPDASPNREHDSLAITRTVIATRAMLAGNYADAAAAYQTLSLDFFSARDHAQQQGDPERAAELESMSMLYEIEAAWLRAIAATPDSAAERDVAFGEALDDGRLGDLDVGMRVQLVAQWAQTTVQNASGIVPFAYIGRLMMEQEGRPITADAAVQFLDERAGRGNQPLDDSFPVAALLYHLNPAEPLYRAFARVKLLEQAVRYQGQFTLYSPLALRVSRDWQEYAEIQQQVTDLLCGLRAVAFHSVARRRAMLEMVRQLPRHIRDRDQFIWDTSAGFYYYPHTLPLTRELYRLGEAEVAEQQERAARLTLPTS